MFAAVSASVPFGIKIIHISGGEETLGAIDNVYRHALTLMADIHFTNTKGNALRVQQIKGSTKNIYHTGSLAIDNIRQTKLLSAKEFQLKFNFDIEEPFVLFTFHPETVNHKLNITYSEVLKKVLIALKENVLVTMPNADTMGNTIRMKLKEAAMQSGKIKLIESLGSSGYYTALSKCKFVMGNSSSGIVEAASFGKYVLNIGDRQKGRERGKNIIDVPVDLKRILHCTKDIIKKRNDIASNIYGDGKAAKRMLAVIKHIKGYSYE
jgi:GDP/UDP-N,N'-diacetylbacillosamine 2-epimerase (hydrolysing)